ncbi:MAG TPA: hypothetical protein ENN60_00995 [archaeon]|nr:hypothetical protein [archaeon]
MDTKQILQMTLGTLALLLGVLLISSYESSALLDTLLTFIIGFLLMLMAGFLWVGTAVGLLK